MRFTSFFTVFVVAAASGVLAGPIIDDGNCGALGHFAPSSLPAGVDPNALRTCHEHPLSNTTSPRVQKRECYLGDQFG
ncbi:hypothetical protein EXIGLDRAFT_731343 [Exidia glandulosa HHB12029]|uniref:Uncharacterized protein n=1 Tax=Exidia glandulosa HHB12029 TaxID=1314781 RepID=A0A165BX90_EXIGL|nr:hypothetical protein EXIGLDRAFT_731343 [Exidia glandulosa HHB12029]